MVKRPSKSSGSRPVVARGRFSCSPATSLACASRSASPSRCCAPCARRGRRKPSTAARRKKETMTAEDASRSREGDVGAPGSGGSGETSTRSSSSRSGRSRPAATLRWRPSRRRSGEERGYAESGSAFPRSSELELLPDGEGPHREPARGARAAGGRRLHPQGLHGRVPRLRPRPRVTHPLGDNRLRRPAPVERRGGSPRRRPALSRGAGSSRRAPRGGRGHGSARSLDLPTGRGC